MKSLLNYTIKSNIILNLVLCCLAVGSLSYCRKMKIYSGYRQVFTMLKILESTVTWKHETSDWWIYQIIFFRFYPVFLSKTKQRQYNLQFGNDWHKKRLHNRHCSFFVLITNPTIHNAIDDRKQKWVVKTNSHSVYIANTLLSIKWVNIINDWYWGKEK